MRTVTASAESECARRSPRAWVYTSLLPKPRTPYSSLRSLVDVAARYREDPRRDDQGLFPGSGRAVNACDLPVTERGHPGRACLRNRFSSIIILRQMIRRLTNL